MCTLTDAAFEAARDCLLCAIHDVDTVTDDIRGKTVTEHIVVRATSPPGRPCHTLTRRDRVPCRQAATPKSLVVPITMLMATGRFTRESARAALAKEPVLRNIVKGLVEADA